MQRQRWFGPTFIPVKVTVPEGPTPDVSRRTLVAPYWRTDHTQRRRSPGPRDGGGGSPWGPPSTRRGTHVVPHHATRCSVYFIGHRDPSDRGSTRRGQRGHPF